MSQRRKGKLITAHEKGYMIFVNIIVSRSKWKGLPPSHLWKHTLIAVDLRLNNEPIVFKKRIWILAYQTIKINTEQLRNIEHTFGSPRLYSATGQPHGLNDQFFAELYRQNYTLIFEPAEHKFYQYSDSTGLWESITCEKLTEQITQCCSTYLCLSGLSLVIPDFRFCRNVMQILKGKSEQQNAPLP